MKYCMGDVTLKTSALPQSSIAVSCFLSWDIHTPLALNAARPSNYQLTSTTAPSVEPNICIHAKHEVWPNNLFFENVLATFRKRSCYCYLELGYMLRIILFFFRVVFFILLKYVLVKYHISTLLGCTCLNYIFFVSNK